MLNSKGVKCSPFNQPPHTQNQNGRLRCGGWFERGPPEVGQPGREGRGRTSGQWTFKVSKFYKVKIWTTGLLEYIKINTVDSRKFGHFFKKNVNQNYLNWEKLLCKYTSTKEKFWIFMSCCISFWYICKNNDFLKKLGCPNFWKAVLKIRTSHV